MEHEAIERGIRRLLYAFDDDAGLPGRVVEATMDVIQGYMGIASANAFANHLDCTDDMFYFKSNTVEDVLHMMEQVSE